MNTFGISPAVILHKRTVAGDTNFEVRVSFLDGFEPIGCAVEGTVKRRLEIRMISLFLHPDGEGPQQPF